MSTETLTLADFLLARIAEDETAARACAQAEGSSEWTADVGYLSDVKGLYIGNYQTEDYSNMHGESARHVARHDPARVLAECEAKRRIVKVYLANMHQVEVLDAEGLPSTSIARDASVLRGALYALALPYADHSDYRQEWRP